MHNHGKKMIAPIVITIIVIAYYIVYFGALLVVLDGIWKYVLGILPVVFIALMIKVCIERIREIRKGEDDDISKY